MSRLATQLVRWVVRCNAEARDFDAKILEAELWWKKTLASNNNTEERFTSHRLGAAGRHSCPSVAPSLRSLMTNDGTWTGHV
jgi:hypothetical protein